MIDWAGIKGATAPLFARLTGLTDAQVRWADESEGAAWTDDPHLELTISDTGSIGMDEERRDDSEDVAGGGNNDGIVTVVGPRTFTLTVACESQVNNIDDARNGAAILGNLLTRLNRQTSIDALVDYYAISDWTKIRRVSYRDRDGNLINRYVFDIFCLTADNDIDTTQDAGGWMGEVIGSGTVNDGQTAHAVTFDVKEE